MKGQLLTLAIAPPLLAAFVYILLHSGPYVALYLWAFVFVVFMVFMTVYPEVIAPLFNKFDTLPEGNLRSPPPPHPPTLFTPCRHTVSQPFVLHPLYPSSFVL